MIKPSISGEIVKFLSYTGTLEVAAANTNHVSVQFALQFFLPIK